MTPRSAHPVLRDERTVATENASYRWAYLVLSYGLLLIVIWRSVVRHEASWDLIALILAGGAVATLYQGRHRVLDRRWAILSAVAMVVAVVVAALLAALLVRARR